MFKNPPKTQTDIKITNGFEYIKALMLPPLTKTDSKYIKPNVHIYSGHHPYRNR